MIYLEIEDFSQLIRGRCTAMDCGMQDIQWFPGHMAKTKRRIAENLKLIDIVAEIVDARIPVSSRNPDIDVLTLNKPKIIIFNKADIADSKKNWKWAEFYKSQGITAILIDCKSGKGVNLFVPTVKSLLKDRLERARTRGIKKNLRVMVIGIPNVGKSSFINRLSGGKKAKVEDRPGVTKGNQWFSISKDVELLDTPGILWPKFDDILVAEKLAFTGAIKDNILDVEQLAVRLLMCLTKDYSENLAKRYKLENSCIVGKSGIELLEMIAKKRGMLVSGGKIDTERAAIMLLDEFRAAKLGRITLD